MPQSFLRSGRWLSLVLVVVLLAPLALGCGTTGPGISPAGPGGLSVAVSPPGGISSSPAVSGGAVAQESSGLIFTLGEGVDVPPAPEVLRLVEGEPLAEEALQALLARLPQLEGETGDQQDFRLPAETIRPPRPGETIEQPFPPEAPTEPAGAPDAGPLEVLRYSPEGDVPLAPFLSVTFSQPMVALGTVEQVAAEDVPVRLDPQPEGDWRWVGTQTLLFEPTARFPMATEYAVEVPAGTTSATGGALEDAVRWSFATPPVTLTSYRPSGGPTVREPVIVAAFDQAVDPAAVLETITLSAGGRTYGLRMATEDGVAADEAASRLIKATEEGRWVALVPAGPLPAATTVTVNVGPGTPSAEGPLVTDRVQSFTFQTYGPLRVEGIECAWGDECPPLTPWYVRFSNPLDEEAFLPEWITVSPALPDLTAAPMGSAVQITGRSAGRTTYTVTVHAGVVDIFGQTLEEDVSLDVRVGAAYPLFTVPGEQFVVLDPAAPPGLSMYSVNYGAARVRAYAVEPEDWPAYTAYLRSVARDRTQDTPPGRRVMDERVTIDGRPDEVTETIIDLRSLRGQGHRHLVLVIEPEVGLIASLRGQTPPIARVWVQMSDLAVDAMTDSEEMVAWATSLAEGAALEGVSLALYPGGETAETGPDGLARLPLVGSASGEGGGYVIARRGSDAALLPENAWIWGGTSWQKRAPDTNYRWYVWDDRGMYRPGEDVHVKGWVRQVEFERGADRLALPGAGQVAWDLIDPRGSTIASGTAELSALGGFDWSVTLPEGMNLGHAYFQIRMISTGGRADYGHAIQVQEFRRPEFEVTATASEGPYFIVDAAVTTVSAAYYAGGPLPGADVHWMVRAEPGTYRPPNWDDFDFGYWVPWWLPGPSAYRWPGGREVRVEHYDALTDAAGEHALRIGFESVDPPRPSVVTAEASVMDVNRQAWAASANMLVHPANLYVGLRSEPTFVERGTPIRVDAIVTDLDGNAVAGRLITVRSVRLQWEYARGEWQEVEVDEQICSVTSEDEPVRCTFETPEGGTYRITASIADDEDRRNETQITRWVSGGQRPSANRVEMEDVTLIPDHEEYAPGDTAQILVQAPFAPAEGLLTVRRLGLVHTERFTMDEPSITLEVPIGEDDIPNVTVQVDLVGTAPRLNAEGEPDDDLPARPAYATGSLDLRVPAYSRTLSVALAPREAELEPGGETVIDLQVRDAEGNAVPDAEVAVVVVDEAVLALTAYELADPITVFYPDRWSGVEDYRLRRFVLLADPDLLEAASRGMANDGARMAAAGMTAEPSAPAAAPPMATQAVAEEAAMDMAGEAGQPDAPIRVRSDFNPLAVFSPENPTDADGTAEVAVDLPDNLTRYRIMAVAVSGETHYGKAEATLTARLPLMVRASAPRFLNFGDRFDLPVVLQNQTDEPLEVDVAVQATNLELTDEAGRTVTVPARDRIEMRFPLTTEQAGTARLLVGAVSGAWADAAQLELPVYTPATTEAFATYGVIDEGAVAQPIVPPEDVYPQFGGLEITTSSTALQALTDAVIYLVQYPYECSEQLASRILAIAALRDVLEAFQAEGLPPAADLDAAVARDIARLEALQNPDGGFPVWTRGRESWPFHSIHAAHSLARAREKDYAVNEETVQRALSYLRDIESHYPHWYSREVRQTLTSYALYTRMLLGDHDPARARRLLDEAGLEGLQPEALGWIYNVLVGDAASADEVAEIERHLANRVVETAGAAHFVTSFREEDGYVLLASDRRADGIILEGLMRAEASGDRPQSDLIPKIVQGLLAHRKAGRWGNTQENAFVLLALDRYFRTYEAQTPDFVARAWLGEDYVGAFTFEGRSTDYQNLTLPMVFLVDREGREDLVLEKDGEGRLYYRLGLRYAPTDLALDPLDQGFVVERRYEAVDDPEDVTRDEDGTWHIRAGARVRVRLTMVALTRRYHVALADPLPAGLEPMNPALAVTGSIPQDPEDQAEAYWWWRWTWYEHQNLRDQRAEAFTSLLWEGIHTYTYVTRATTPGDYVVPPARAEEMYAPETFGRSGTDRVIVE